MPPTMATRPELFGNVGSNVAPRQPIDVAGAVQSLSEGAGSLIHATMQRKQAEFERAHQIAQEAIERQHWATQAGWHQDEVARQVENDRIKNMLAGYVPATAGTPATPDTTRTIAPAVPTNAPGQFSATGPPVNPILSAVQAKSQPVASASAGGAVPPDVSAPAASPTFTPTAPPTPAPAVLRVAGKPAVPGVPEHVDPTLTERYRQGMDVGAMTVAGRQSVADTGAAAREESARIAAEGRARVATIHADRMKAGGKPDYIDNGVAYYRNPTTKLMEPALGPDGQPLPVAGMTPAQKSSADAKVLGTMNQQVNHYGQVLAGAKADYDAIAAKYAGKDDPVSTQKVFAAKKALQRAQQKADSVSGARDSKAREQQDGVAAPVAGPTTASAQPDPAAEQRAHYDAAAAALTAQKKTPAQITAMLGARP